MAFETIRYNVDGRVATITLSRPERLNAISRAMMAEIGEALDRAEAGDDIAAIVVNGDGRAFSAGMDLKDDAAAGIEGADGWRQVLSEDLAFIMRFWDSPKVTIAAVHGHCMAAAFDLAIACDITFAEQGTVFGKPELQFASVITAMLLPQVTGPKLAKELLLAADDRISAERLRDAGVINQMVPRDEGAAAARAMADRVGQMDDLGVQLTKRSINNTIDRRGLRDALAANIDLAVEIEASETPSRRDFKERVRRDGLKAALAWRSARMQG